MDSFKDLGVILIELRRYYAVKLRMPDLRGGKAAEARLTALNLVSSGPSGATQVSELPLKDQIKQ